MSQPDDNGRGDAYDVEEGVGASIVAGVDELLPVPRLSGFAATRKTYRTRDQARAIRTILLTIATVISPAESR